MPIRGNHRAKRPSLENVRGDAVCMLKLMLKPVLYLEAIRIIAYDIEGYQSTSLFSDN